jgi:hypothetical protein
MTTHPAWLVLGSILVLLPEVLHAQTDASTPHTLAFTHIESGEYHFSTGVIEGSLRARGEALGPSEVIYTATGQPISRVYGWLNHYRVFSTGVRYGRGMRHLPSESALSLDGSVTTHWPADSERPFHMTAVYRWVAPHILDVDTTVEAEEDLPGFELFLASYFPDTFSEVGVPVTSPDASSGVRWLHADEEAGYRQAFPRDEAAAALILDGRWALDPNPIEWTLQTERAWPMSWRRDPETGVTVVFMTDPVETFATYSPHATQRHYALYYSLFGRDLAPGETAIARARAVVLMNPDEDALLREAGAFFGRLPPQE